MEQASRLDTVLTDRIAPSSEVVSSEGIQEVSPVSKDTSGAYMLLRACQNEVESAQASSRHLASCELAHQYWRRPEPARSFAAGDLLYAGEPS